MIKNNSFKFASESIHPGESLTLALPLPQVFSCAPLYMPIKLVHGKKQGPTLLLVAAMYGDELNGTEIIQRLLNLPILSKLSGTLIAIPVMNVHGLINRSRYLPNGLDLNHHFPGHPQGSNSERLAHIFVTEILQRAEYCINLQTAPLNHYNFPLIQFYENNETDLQLAKTFNAPIIVKAEATPGSLQAVALGQNKSFLNYVAGEAMRFDDHAIRVGIQGILNVMRKLQMLPEKASNPEKKATSIRANHLTWISACASGTNHSKKKLGQKVEENEVLSIIKDPFVRSDDVQLKSPQAGIIVGKNNTPLIHEGDSLFQLAVIPEISNAGMEHFEEWQQEQAQKITNEDPVL